MSNYNSIIVDTPQEKVSRITLNRPKQRNSLSAELRTELFQALENNGLKLTLFEEFDYCPYMLENMIEKEKGKYVLEIRKNLATPYVFNLKATKK